MVVTVAIVLVVQVTVDEVVDVIAVGNCGMSATWAMDMVRAVGRATVPPGACRRILLGNLQDMLLDPTVCGRMVQVSIVEVVDVTVVLNCGMPAVFAMNMVVVFVMVRHL
jgi:hypothetical protein